MQEAEAVGAGWILGHLKKARGLLVDRAADILIADPRIVGKYRTQRAFMSDSIKEQLVRLGAERPDLRKHIRPLLANEYVTLVDLDPGRDERRQRRNRDYNAYHWRGDYIVHPVDLLKKALQWGDITQEEYDDAVAYRNKDLAGVAMNMAEDIEEDYRGSGQGIGSSDMNIFTKRMLKNYNRRKASRRAALLPRLIVSGPYIEGVYAQMIANMVRDGKVREAQRMCKGFSRSWEQLEEFLGKADATELQELVEALLKKV